MRVSTEGTGCSWTEGTEFVWTEGTKCVSLRTHIKGH